MVLNQIDPGRSKTQTLRWRRPLLVAHAWHVEAVLHGILLRHTLGICQTSSSFFHLQSHSSWLINVCFSASSAFSPTSLPSLTRGRALGARAMHTPRQGGHHVASPASLLLILGGQSLLGLLRPGRQRGHLPHSILSHFRCSSLFDQASIESRSRVIIPGLMLASGAASRGGGTEKRIDQEEHWTNCRI